VAVERDKNGRIKKGSTANPNGRPKREFAIPEIIRERGKLPFPNDAEKRTFFVKMVDTPWMQAANGDKDARNWITDRTEGKAVERIEQEIKRDEIVIK